MPGPTGDRVGSFRLLERLGEAGMGIVYRAEQTEPVRREVALKVLKPGMDSEGVVARFDAERQSLALMEHPSIAAVHDAGTTDAGRPYFVMELVRGVPLPEYCDAKCLDVPARVAFFVQVCRAVQHAHQKGVIHRDLKPSNILVTEADGKPLPKVIDFGIARATAEDADGTRLTRADGMVGTPAYMSPEQMGDAPDVDTRADIYALGVLLYQLLTGTLPFDPSAYRGWAAYAAVNERPTPTPSARFRAWEGAAAAAERRDPDTVEMTAAGNIVFTRAGGSTWKFTGFSCPDDPEDFSVANLLPAPSMTVFDAHAKMGTFKYSVTIDTGEVADPQIINRT